jgi:GNAT superfamily N-acetyltransferase
VSSLVLRTEAPMSLPSPRVPVSVRLATMADFGFIDALQKQTTRMVGWMPERQLREKVERGQCLIAEAIEGEKRSGGEEETSAARPPPLLHASSPLLRPLGYVIGQDQYFKRDDVGIIYALNVVPGHQRSLIGANLLKAMFDRAAHGCRLFCCWCAQDIAANRFWEAMGFVPLAFRAGSCRRQGAKKARVHIFWQRRIRAGDDATPYWFPSQTTGGSIREDRLVLPIPPGVHWSDAQPIILPGVERREEPEQIVSRERAPQRNKPPAPELVTLQQMGGLRLPLMAAKGPVVEKAKAEPKRKVKNDPKLVAAARELRDRWLEWANATPLVPHGKYDVSRAIEERVNALGGSTQLALPAPLQIAA